MNKTPRTPAFKKKIALQALREEKTIEEIAKEYNLNRVLRPSYNFRGN